VKQPSDEPQANWFAFPIGVTGGEYHFDAPAAILRPGLQPEGDMLPGAGRTCLAAQTFLAATSKAGTTILATPDAHLLQLGGQALADPLADSEPSSPLALSLVLHNFTRNDRAVSQGGQANFSFRYAVTSHSGLFSATAAVRFGGDVARTLPAAWVTGEPLAPLPAGAHSFLPFTPENVVATGLKPAEEGEGWVLRLWEVGGRDCDAIIDARALGVTRAWRCDLLEGKLEELAVADGTVRLAMPSRSLRAIRLE